MHRPSVTLLTLVVGLAVLVGIVGGGVMGGYAGYYAAQMALVPSVDASPAASFGPATPLAQAAPSLDTNRVIKEDSAVIQAVRKTKVAVVTIIGKSRPGVFGNADAPEVSGSGIIVDLNGHIVTNNHVIEDDQTIQVIFADGRRVDASVVGSDPKTDVAVLQVSGGVPAAVEFGNSDAVMPGQVAIAIGSPLGDFRGSVTVGVISALNRQVGRQQGLIQTDAAINNGNSGGPLINSAGQVIGINTLVVRSTGEGNVAEGLGFAIPSNVVRGIVSQLIAKGSAGRPS